MIKTGRLILVGALLFPMLDAVAAVSTFESVVMPNEQPYSGGGRYWAGLTPPLNGSLDSSFVSGSATFFNSNVDFGGAAFWSGFAYSNTTDVTTGGFGNQYSAFPGGGADGSENYAVSFDHGARIEFAVPTALQSVMLTNTTYAALSMRDGDSFAKKFGGDTGDDEDFFELVITGEDGSGKEISSLSFYLADFRDSNNANDYIVEDWRTVSLLSLGVVDALSFSYRSSDVSGAFINTPTYFALDNLAPVPLPAGIYLFAAGLSLLAARQRRIKTGR